MDRGGKRGMVAEKACVLLYFCLFSWPFLGIFDVPAGFPAVPSFLSWIFFFWGVLVYALFALARRSGKR